MSLIVWVHLQIKLITGLLLLCELLKSFHNLIALEYSILINVIPFPDFIDFVIPVWLDFQLFIILYLIERNYFKISWVQITFLSVDVICLSKGTNWALLAIGNHAVRDFTVTLHIWVPGSCSSLKSITSILSSLLLLFLFTRWLTIHHSLVHFFSGIILKEEFAHWCEATSSSDNYLLILNLNIDLLSIYIVIVSWHFAYLDIRVILFCVFKEQINVFLTDSLLRWWCLDLNDFPLILLFKRLHGHV